MHNPVATYRLQFHKEFTFEAFERIIPYLQKLGVSTIYASPIFAATPGSTHGYDGTNPHRINPEIGTEEQLKTLAGSLKEQGISWLQDIVPNHMAFHPNNPFLMDVLEKGPLSLYHQFFDINWTSSLYQGRVMVPFLGSKLEEVIQNKELQVAFDAVQQRLVLKYYDSAYPLNPKSYEVLLRGEGEPNQAIEQLLEKLDEAHKDDDPKGFFLKWEEFRQQLVSLMKNDTVASSVEASLRAFNENPEKLQQLAEQQIYQLCHWQETDYQINFRRFFTVNGLICLNIQDPEVFHIYHQYIKQLLDEGVFQGLRIDHVDGLYDPTGYLQQLRELVGEGTYIGVEKILEPGEPMPKQWPIQGNTGYDFLSYVNNLFTYKPGQEAFDKLYHQLVGEGAAVHDQIHEKKAYILNNHMGGELENLYQLFLEQRLVDEEVLSSVTGEQLKAAIGEFLVQCPVYRYYGNQMPLDGEEAEAVQNIFNSIRESKPELTGAVELLERAILGAAPEGEDDTYLQRSQRFYQRLMQFSGPLMAKGVEDTIMYTYNRFIGHNEVGDAPEAFGVSPEEFHQIMQDRQQNWPLSINGTSTHDTKRGEDVRARLNVLTEIADYWTTAVQEWRELNADLKQNNMPDANDEYLIYQTLLGAYPMPGQDEDDFENRVQEYIQKALREAKVNSNWTTPNEEYESAAKAFAVKLLDKSRPFWSSFEKFRSKTTDFGIVNSLSQVLLKFTAPGVPDVYQGTELWDFSLVDPDNRRAVDYEKRQAWLEELDSIDLSKLENLWEHLWVNRYDARIKLWLTRTLFTERKNNADLFAKGEYLPLEVEGESKDHVLAFARKHLHTWYIVAVPLHLAALAKELGVETLEQIDWKDTKVILPKEAPKDWQDTLVRSNGSYAHELSVGDLFGIFPLALLKLRAKNERGAGILLHISSLTSPFGIGDMGPEARNFANFLQASNQKYWQLLPLNPIEAGQGYSPYSSISSRAGNPLLISPELLAKEGLLNAEELSQYHLPQTGSVDYEQAKRVKDELLEKAWQTFKNGDFPALQQQFVDYCGTEAGWLHDFALYVLLKDQNGGSAWFQWEEKYKQRDPEALEQLVQDHAEAIEKTKWVQFIFNKQWKRLRTYCNNRGIQMFGDMPFYISYDSVDVWGNRDIFAVDEEGNMTGVAGVPPDSFSEDGQLWGMPVFKWDVLKEQGYDWWMGRLRKNMELYDLVRLDHFRAFADYWEVPAGEETAKNGEWKLGPGADFFTFVEKELGSLPFIAEDLGEINDLVLKLRDDFNLPGMKILQFAWGDEMPQNDYMPHNYARNFIAYTGTHDNNTTLGWYRQEGKPHHQQIEHYVGRELSEHDIWWVMARLAYASVAKTAILPMQDVLGIDEQGRMNTPGQGQGNWGWRLVPGQITKETENQLKEWTWLYNRD
ncbi:malto-oligosyltrehalose synthase [Rufibacter quisquiliarum]|uniref:4-alpha-glucanotransferase n=1 Tax=Rufibacter quisquiliarum TaxID=1549639 RepID=A0A839GNM5_9BACT|nr:malto-oligosyltrehalose synthase [Rufibacter quisquiliarum]MBA9079553.1 malto-oligosyltrehalose synthase/4-alpha-glucanotransferase [Rufibacter quisquiliarum]